MMYSVSAIVEEGCPDPWCNNLVVYSGALGCSQKERCVITDGQTMHARLPI